MNKKYRQMHKKKQLYIDETNKKKS